MKAFFPLFALTLLGTAQAAEPAVRAEAAASTRASAAADGTAVAVPAARARAAAYADPAAEAAARKELDDLREQMRELGRKMGDISLRLGDGGARNFAWRYLGDSDRAMLGIVMRGDDKGLRIAAVTPGGPADKAGVRNDDVLLAIDGNSLGGDELASARKVLEALKVDQPVRLALSREGKKLDVVVKAARREALNWPKVMADSDIDLDIDVNVDVDRIQRDVERKMRGAQRQIERSVRQGNLQQLRDMRINLMPWWGINLAPLNPDLSQYFGTDTGVLVLSADTDNMPELKGGDILQSVDGNKVEQPGDVMRRLRDAKAGSEVKLGVLRQKKTLTLNTKVPEYKAMFPLPPEPPTPPTPPTPPAAPAVAAPPAPPAPPAPVAAVPPPPPHVATAPTPPVPPTPPPRPRRDD